MREEDGVMSSDDGVRTLTRDGCLRLQRGCNARGQAVTEEAALQESTKTLVIVETLGAPG